MRIFGDVLQKMSTDSFFLMLAAIGIIAGFAIFALKNPLKDAVGHDT